MAGKGEVRYRITADPSSFKKAFKEAGDQVSDFADGLKARLGPAGEIVAKLGPAGLAAAAGLGALAVAGAGAAAAVEKALAKADRIANLSASTGLAAESLQRLAPAAITSGQSIEALAGGITKLQKNLVDSPAKFDALGLSAKRLVEMRPETAFSEVAKAVASIDNPTRQAAAAMEYFGKSGASLLPAMKADLEGLARKADELGLVMSEQTIAALDELGDELDLTKEAGGAVVENFGAIVGTAPGATAAVGALGRAFGALSKLMEENKGPVQSVVSLLAEAFVGAVNVAGNATVNLVRQVSSQVAAVVEVARKVGAGDLRGAWSTVTNYKAPATTWQDFGAGGGNAGGGGGKPRGYTPPDQAAAAAKEIQKLERAYNDSLAGMVRAGEKAVPSLSVQLSGLMDNFELMADAPALLAKGEAAVAKWAQGQAIAGSSAMFGGGLFTRQADVLDAEIGGQFESIVAREREAAAATDTWAARLEVVSNIAQSMGGSFGKAFGSLAGGVSGFMAASEGITRISGQKGIGSLFSGGLSFVEKLGNVSSIVGMAGAAVGVAKTVFSGLKSIFGGDQAKNDAKEAGRILGREVSKEQAKQLAQDAKAAGKTFTEYVRGLRAEEDRKKAAEAQAKVVSGLSTARTGAEALMARLGEGGQSEGLAAALSAIIGKVGNALAGAGMGYLSPALRDSQAYQSAQGTSSEIGQVLGGMREAGKIDRGLLGATADAAGALKDQAIAAAQAAGLEPAEASKAGFAAISDILREQLNASVSSGTALDSNIQALLDEAKANGIEIMADPMIEQVAVSKESRDLLKTIAGQGGGGVEHTYSSAGGFGNSLTPRTVGPGGARFQVHAGEGVLVVPRRRMNQPGRFAYISAARGYYEDDSDPRNTGGAAGGGNYPSPATTSTDLSGSGGAGVPSQLLEAVAELRRAAAEMSTAQPIQVTNAPTVQVVDQSAVKTAEGQRAFGKFVQSEVERALDMNARGLTSKIEAIARRAVGRSL